MNKDGNKKIGRNDPCPCGSGKKYKRCCLPLGEVSKDGASRTSDWPVSRLSIARYMEHFYEHPKRLQEIIKVGRFNTNIFKKTFSERWTISKVRKMSTQAIIEKMRSMNINFEVEEFKRQAQGYISSTKLADDHYYTQKHSASGLDEDFIWLAMMELWKRIVPERYSVEMVDDLVQDGYDDIGRRNYREGIAKWEKAWNIIRAMVPSDIRSVEGADEFIPELTQSVSNWCQDFEMELGNAAVDDESFYKKRIEYCHDFCRRFPDSDELIMVNMLRAEAESYDALGNRGTADKLFQALVERFPDNPWCYIGWGDIYSDFYERDRYAPDYEKAKRIYELALTRCRTDRDVIIERLDDLKGEMKENRVLGQKKVKFIDIDGEP